jgi:hypothetical protein
MYKHLFARSTPRPNICPNRLSVVPLPAIVRGIDDPRSKSVSATYTFSFVSTQTSIELYSCVAFDSAPCPSAINVPLVYLQL